MVIKSRRSGVRYKFSSESERKYYMSFKRDFDSCVSINVVLFFGGIVSFFIKRYPLLSFYYKYRLYILLINVFVILLYFVIYYKLLNKLWGVFKNILIKKENTINNINQQITQLTLGHSIDNKRNILYWDFMRVPHLALSIPTGGGKTSLFRHMIQEIKDSNINYQIFILDMKPHSYNDLKNDKINVYYKLNNIVTTLNGIVMAMDKVYDDLAIKGVDALSGFGRMFIFVEELNSMSEFFKSESDLLYKDFKRLLSRLIFLGREVHIHVLLGAQRLSVAALGSGDMRENFASFVIGSPSKNTWDMLVGSVIPYPSFDNINELTFFIDNRNNVIPIKLKQLYLK